MGWVDLSEVADQWGQPPDQATCRTVQSSEPTIRDYVHACPLAFPMVSNFRVVPFDLCPTHSTLQVQLKPPPTSAWQYTPVKRHPLAELVGEAFTSWHGAPPTPLQDHQLLDPDVSDVIELPEEVRASFDVNVPSSDVKKLAKDSYKWAKLAHDHKRSTFDT